MLDNTNNNKELIESDVSAVDLVKPKEAIKVKDFRKKIIIGLGIAVIITIGLIFGKVVLDNSSKIQTDNNEMLVSTDNSVEISPIPDNAYEGWKTVTAENMRITMKIPADWSIKEEMDNEDFYTQVNFIRGATVLNASINNFQYGIDEFCVEEQMVEGEGISFLPSGEQTDYKINLNGDEEILHVCYLNSGDITSFMIYDNEYINVGYGITFNSYKISREEFETFKLILQSITFTEDKTIVHPTDAIPVPTTATPTPTPHPKYTIDFNPSGPRFTSHYFNDEFYAYSIPKGPHPEESYTTNIVNVMQEATIKDEYGNIVNNVDNKLCSSFTIGEHEGVDLCFENGFFVGNALIVTTTATVRVKSDSVYAYDGRYTEITTPVDVVASVTSSPTILCYSCAGGVVYNNEMELKAGVEVKLYLNNYTWNQSIYLPENKLTSSNLVATTLTDKFGRFMFRDLNLNTYNYQPYGLPKTSYTLVATGYDPEWTYETHSSKLILNRENGQHSFIMDNNRVYQQMGFKLLRY